MLDGYAKNRHTAMEIEAFLGPLFSFWYYYTTKGLKVSEIAQKRPKNGFLEVRSDRRWNKGTEKVINTP